MILKLMCNYVCMSHEVVTYNLSSLIHEEGSGGLVCIFKHISAVVSLL